MIRRRGGRAESYTRPATNAGSPREPMGGTAMADVGGSFDPEGTVTVLIKSLKVGDQEAARRLWERYFADLVRLARARLKNAPRGAADEEDVALDAFDCLCRGVQAGRFPRLDNREDLWRILLTITVRKAFNHVEYERRLRRGGVRAMAEAARLAEALQAEGDLTRAPCREPSPELA